jgi:FHS family glucose/mannose:H+ symporter-like MFS transporter
MALVGALESWIIEDLSVPHALTGGMQSALFSGNVVGSFLASWLMYKLRPRRLGLLSIVLMLVGTFLSGVKTYELVVVARFITGLGYSGSVIFYGAVIVHAFPAKQATFLNIYHAAFAIGAGITLLIARPLATALGDWPAAFWLGALVCLVPLVIFIMARLPDMHEDEPFSLRNMAHVLRNLAIVATFIVVMGYVASEQALTVFTASFAQQTLGLSVATAAQVAALFWFGVMAGRLSSAAISHKLAEPPQMVACVLLMALFMLTGMTVRQPGVLAVSTFLVGIFAGPIMPLAFSFGVRGTEQLKSAIVALVNLTSCIGGVIGPIIVGAIGDQSSLEQGLNVSAVILIVCILPFILTQKYFSKARIRHQP